jgi:hypothetical protein
MVIMGWQGCKNGSSIGWGAVDQFEPWAGHGGRNVCAGQAEYRKPLVSYHTSSSKPAAFSRAAFAVCETMSLSFDRTGQQAFDKVALQGKEHKHGHDHRDESRGSQHLPVAA